MSTLTGLLVGLLIGLVVVLFLRFRWADSAGAEGDSTPPQRAEAPQGRYRGVSIRTAAQSCAAARQLNDKRFLPGDAPALPLPGCDEDKCGCRFVHHEDRRDEDDRRDEFATFGGFHPRSGTEQRRPKGDRRKRWGRPGPP